MTEQEKLHHAKHYIDSLANGLNPLDGTPIPEQDIVNNVKISRCLFFVSDVLRKQLDGHEPKKVSEKDKKLFYITEEEKLQYLEIIQKNSNLLLQLINDILDLSRIESGKSEMHLLKVIRPEGEYWTSTDRNRLMQVVFNFL